MNKKPTHDLTLITPATEQGGRDTFTSVCGVWLTTNGDGFTGTIPAGMTVTGRFLIQKRREPHEEA